MTTASTPPTSARRSTRRPHRSRGPSRQTSLPIEVGARAADHPPGSGSEPEPADRQAGSGSEPERPPLPSESQSSAPESAPGPADHQPGSEPAGIRRPGHRNRGWRSPMRRVRSSGWRPAPPTGCPGRPRRAALDGGGAEGTADLGPGARSRRPRPPWPSPPPCARPSCAGPHLGPTPHPEEAVLRRAVWARRRTSRRPSCAGPHLGPTVANSSRRAMSVRPCARSGRQPGHPRGRRGSASSMGRTTMSRQAEGRSLRPAGRRLPSASQGGPDRLSGGEAPPCCSSNGPALEVRRAGPYRRAAEAGGRPPLAAGSSPRSELAAGRPPAPQRPLLVVVADGRATAAPAGRDPVEAAMAAAHAVRRKGLAAVVVDVESGPTG